MKDDTTHNSKEIVVKIMIEFLLLFLSTKVCYSLYIQIIVKLRQRVI